MANTAWNPEAIRSSLLEAETSLLERLKILAPDECKHLPKEAPDPEKVPSLLAAQLLNVQDALQKAKAPSASLLSLWKRGGHEGWAVDIRLAALDSDSDGILDDQTIENYMQIGARVVDATKDFATNNGVVGALMVSVLLPVSVQMILDYDSVFNDESSELLLAEQERVAGAAPVVQLATLNGRYGGYANLDVRFYCNAVAFMLMTLATFLGIMLVAVCARIYTQISFWMPNLESKVWYAQYMADTLQSLETMKTSLLIFTIISLVLMATAKALWMGLALGIPAVIALGWYWRLELSASSACSQQLIEQTRMVLPAARTKAKQAHLAKKVLLRQNPAPNPPMSGLVRIEKPAASEQESLAA